MRHASLTPTPTRTLLLLVAGRLTADPTLTALEAVESVVDTDPASDSFSAGIVLARLRSLGVSPDATAAQALPSVIAHLAQLGLRLAEYRDTVPAPPPEHDTVETPALDEASDLRGAA